MILLRVLASAPLARALTWLSIASMETDNRGVLIPAARLEERLPQEADQTNQKSVINIDALVKAG